MFAFLAPWRPRVGLEGRANAGVVLGVVDYQGFHS